MGRGSLELFLDVFNAYDHLNVRGHGYDFRRQGDRITTVRDVGEELLPLLPTVGFRWAFCRAAAAVAPVQAQHIGGCGVSAGRTRPLRPPAIP